MLARAVLMASLVVMGTVLAADPPPKCCFEKEFTASLGEVGARVVDGHPTALTGTMDIAYDFYRKRSGSKSVIEMNGVRTTLFTLRDYANRYIYEKPAIGTCTYHRMGDHFQMYPPCVPENSTYLGPADFGYGSEILKTHNWEVRMQHPDLTFKLSVTEDCVPVFDAFYGTRHGNPSEMTFFFTGYHPGIDSMESLNIPDGCVLIENPHHHGNGTHGGTDTGSGSTGGTGGTGNRPIGRRFVRPI